MINLRKTADRIAADISEVLEGESAAIVRRHRSGYEIRVLSDKLLPGDVQTKVNQAFRKAAGRSAKHGELSFRVRSNTLKP